MLQEICCNVDEPLYETQVLNMREESVSLVATSCFRILNEYTFLSFFSYTIL